MHIFVTGASGFIGTAVLPELIGAGHTVTGLARSEASAAIIEGLGAQALRGEITDIDVLQQGVRDADGVIHLAFNHDFSQIAASSEIERAAIEAMGQVLANTGGALVVASGVLGLAPGRVTTEQDATNAQGAGQLSPRLAGVRAVEALTERGVRTAIVRLAPCVHDDATAKKCGFVMRLAEIARRTGISAYVGDGTNRWSAVHRLDAASLFRLAAEKAPAGAILHGVADEGVPLRRIAEIISAHLGVPVRAISPAEAPTHFAFMTPMVVADGSASSAYTQELLGWEPVHASLVEDLESGHFFDEPAA